jgi:hypothetical protein
VFEKWSRAKDELFALRAEKARDGLFQHPARALAVASMQFTLSPTHYSYIGG